MNPDGVFAIEVEGNRQEAEPLPQAADVFLVTNRLVDEVRRYDDKKRERQQAVDRVHEANIVE